MGRFELFTNTFEFPDGQKLLSSGGWTRYRETSQIVCRKDRYSELVSEIAHYAHPRPGYLGPGKDGDSALLHELGPDRIEGCAAGFHHFDLQGPPDG